MSFTDYTRPRRRLRQACRAAVAATLGVGLAWALAACTSTPLPPHPALPGAAVGGAGPDSAPGAAPAQPPRDWNSYKVLAAQRLVAANPDLSYMGPVPEPLLGIPVLDIELNADGSVRRIEVVRTPPRAASTVRRAIEAVHRAAPFPAVAHLPRPWTYRETFLYAEDGRFKPRTLDQ